MTQAARKDDAAQENEAREGDVAALAGLLVAPAIVGVGLVVAPVVHVSAAWAAALTFGGAVVTVVASLAATARARLGRRAIAGAIALGVGAVAVVGVLRPDPRVAAVVVDLGLVAIALGAGGGIGRRIEHAGHLLPACAVAAAADVASAVSPAGPTHAIAESPRALALLALSFPVPGTTSVAPAIGLGDALFLALVFGAARAHGLSRARVAVAGGLGFAVAGALAAALDGAIPALPALGVCVLALVPEARRVRPRDRAVTQAAVVLAAAVAIAVALQRLL